MSHIIARRHFATAKQKDPSRTSVIIKLYARNMQIKLATINRAIRTALVTRDVFGFKRGLLLHSAVFNIDIPPDKAWSVQDFAGKNRAFGKWLNDTLNGSFLEDTGLALDVTPAWIQTFIRSAYSKGATTALNAIGANNPGVSTLGVQALLNIPFHRDRLTALFDRNFTELKGFSASMSTNLQRIIADGLLKGDNPTTMANAISARLGVESRRATLIARTEVIRTNADAQLNTFERFGVAKVSLEAEWITAGDDRVCEECDGMAGEVMSIEDARGMIPLHPDCRCDWLPVQE